LAGHSPADLLFIIRMCECAIVPLIFTCDLGSLGLPRPHSVAAVGIQSCLEDRQSSAAWPSPASRSFGPRAALRGCGGLTRSCPAR